MNKFVKDTEKKIKEIVIEMQYVCLYIEKKKSEHYK